MPLPPADPVEHPYDSEGWDSMESEGEGVGDVPVPEVTWWDAKFQGGVHVCGIGRMTDEIVATLGLISSRMAWVRVEKGDVGPFGLGDIGPYCFSYRYVCSLLEEPVVTHVIVEHVTPVPTLIAEGNHVDQAYVPRVAHVPYVPLPVGMFSHVAVESREGSPELEPPGLESPGWMPESPEWSPVTPKREPEADARDVPPTPPYVLPGTTREHPVVLDEA